MYIKYVNFVYAYLHLYIYICKYHFNCSSYSLLIYRILSAYSVLLMYYCHVWIRLKCERITKPRQIVKQQLDEQLGLLQTGACPSQSKVNMLRFFFRIQALQRKGLEKNGGHKILCAHYSLTHLRNRRRNVSHEIHKLVVPFSSRSVSNWKHLQTIWRQTHPEMQPSSTRFGAHKIPKIL